jgi:rhomboid protease GluP
VIWRYQRPHETAKFTVLRASAAHIHARMTYKTGVASSVRPEPARWFGLGPVTALILVANLVIFALEVVAARSGDAIASVPPEVRTAFGANFAPLTLGLGQYDRLLSCAFVHGSLLHVGVNMWSFTQLGAFVERTIGSARYAILYVLSALASSAASLAWGLLRAAPVSSVGASGAICGVMGAALVLDVRLEGWRAAGMARQIAFWLLVLVAYGAARTDIDNAAHFGGVVAGVAIAMTLRRGVAYPSLTTYASVVVCAALCLAAGLTTAHRDATDPFGNVETDVRVRMVQEALHEGDCIQARRALVASEAVARGAPELRGLRATVENTCPPGSL